MGALFTIPTMAANLARRAAAATLRLAVPAISAKSAGPKISQYRLNLMSFSRNFNASPRPGHSSVRQYEMAKMQSLSSRQAFTASSVDLNVGFRNLQARMHPKNITPSCFSRAFSSKATEKQHNKARKEVTTIEDPFDSPTYHIPEKPVTFTEGASYSLIILAGLGVAGAAGYAVFKELIFQPKEYKIFDKALKRIQDDSQVRVRIGSPIKGYGQETRNRAARQRIPNRIFTDEDGVEHVEVNFYIRGPQGAGKVYTEMFKDKVENEWKYTYLVVEILSPSPAKLMLESYIPA